MTYLLPVHYPGYQSHEFSRGDSILKPLRKKQTLSLVGLGTLAILLTGCGVQHPAPTPKPAPPSTTTQPVVGELPPSPSTPIPGAKAGPFSRVYYPQNLPSKADAAAFPTIWTHNYANPSHNSAFSAGANAPTWLMHGVSWAFPEARAWPLSNGAAYDTNVYGAKTALPTQTQFYGNAVGVSAVDGIIYAESDDDFAYAVNAKTGQLIWRNSPVGNHLMGDP
ncbi:MAG: hypothetical protein OWS74_04275, partial [Firmicutes bacterium]|nr:hypothetical protein [Bacillota bacterium]